MLQTLPRGSIISGFNLTRIFRGDVMSSSVLSVRPAVPAVSILVGSWAVSPAQCPGIVLSLSADDLGLPFLYSGSPLREQLVATRV